jgi:outer membrane protein assembly factor BamE (lipoprotein component of BamABCDE complex)
MDDLAQSGATAMAHHGIGSAGRRAGVWSGLVTGAALLGCVPQVTNHGYRFDEAALAQVEPGRTTRDEVQQLLGSPSSIATFDGAVWYYVSQRTERMSFYQEDVVNQDVVSFTFDDFGTVRSVDRHGLERAHEVSMVDRETPTSGSELNAFEQFIGNIGRFNPPADAERP